MVQPGAAVEPNTVVARAMLPGPLQTLKLAERLGCEAKDVASFFRLKPGDPIAKGQIVAESKGIFGMFKQSIASEFDGTIETVSEVTGNALIREPSIPVDVTAYIHGTVAEVIPEEGAIIETRGAMIQGIFGVGGERTGEIRVAVASPKDVLEASSILPTDAGKILVGGSGISYEAILKANQMGVLGLVAGGVKDSDLTQFLGYDIGVAITGTEAINVTLVVTEGFGYLMMADRTFNLLKSLEGKSASINGATQIRAGVIRPEVIVPLSERLAGDQTASQVFELTVGTPIRVIREPYFGRLAKVTDLPAQLMTVDSGTEVRVLKALLDDGGGEVVVPRANVEIVAG